MKPFKGRMTELDVVLADCMAYDISAAKIAKDKISLEWIEGDDSFYAFCGQRTESSTAATLVARRSMSSGQ